MAYEIKPEIEGSRRPLVKPQNSLHAERYDNVLHNQCTYTLLQLSCICQELPVHNSRPLALRKKTG